MIERLFLDECQEIMGGQWPWSFAKALFTQRKPDFNQSNCLNCELPESKSDLFFPCSDCSYVCQCLHTGCYSNKTNFFTMQITINESLPNRRSIITQKIITLLQIECDLLMFFYMTIQSECNSCRQQLRDQAQSEAKQGAKHGMERQTNCNNN